MARWTACVTGKLNHHAELASLVYTCSFLPVLCGWGPNVQLCARARSARPRHCCGWAACTLALFFTPAEPVPSDL